MKIVFTGGGTGGHFYPHIAVIEEIKKLVAEEKLVEPKFYYLADKPYDKRALFENGVIFRQITAGKMRRYWSVLNFLDIFKTAWGMIKALGVLFFIYPDVVFSKGGYASFPVLWSARLLGIPVIIHESDSHPGKVSLWSGHFARKIALSYPEAAGYFAKAGDQVAVTGNPIRNEIISPIASGANEFLHLASNLPTLLILGGSQGATKINDTVLDILAKLIENYQVIHQAGQNNFADVKNRADFLLTDNSFRDRYKLFAYLNDTALRMAAGVTTLIISRAGSQIFEIANWGLPAIIIPIPEAISHDQRTNAFTYARSGGAVVIEEKNLTPSVLLSEINRLTSNQALLEEMRKGAKSFARPDAARIIAKEIIAIGLDHES